MRKVMILATVVFITAHSGVNSFSHLSTPDSLTAFPLLYEAEFDWHTLETSHFITYYRTGHKIFAQRAAELAESIYDDAASFMRYWPEKKTEIVILPSDTHFFSWESSFSDRAYASSSGRKIMLIYGCPFTTEVCGWNYLDVERALAHEFNHVLFYWIMENPTYIDGLNSIHEWIMEGVATYYEKYALNLDDDYFMLPMVIQYLEDENNLPVHLEEITFNEYGRLSYPLAASVIQFMFDEYGEEEFYMFLRSLREWDMTMTSGQNVERALRETFGMAKEEFEKEWIFYLKENYSSAVEEEFKGIQLTQPPGWRVPSSWYGDKILFVSDIYQNLDIFVMNQDGTGIRQLTRDKACDFDPKFSPDGRKIAFTSLKDGYAHIYCMNEDGSEIVQLTFGESMDFMGSWSPDGQSIAFTSERNGNYDVYCMSKDGSQIVQLTRYEGDDGAPDFSPDGKKIVFVSERKGSYDLYVMNADGTGVQQLTDTVEYENFPMYSPDGKKIVFASRWETDSEICIMESDGTGRRTIVVSPELVVDVMARHRDRILGYPVWSPDGSYIAFTAVNQIFTLRVGPFDLWWIILIVISVIVIIYAVWILGKYKLK